MNIVSRTVVPGAPAASATIENVSVNGLVPEAISVPATVRLLSWPVDCAVKGIAKASVEPWTCTGALKVAVNHGVAVPSVE